MSAHRVLRDLFRGFESVGPGVGNDPGNAGTIAPTMWGQTFPIVTGTTETRTLARPDKAGILVSVTLDADGGDLTLTVTGGYNSAGDTSITFGDAGDMVAFLSVKTGLTYQWTVIAQEGTNIAQARTQAIVTPGAVTVDGTVNRATVTNAVNGAITLAVPTAAMKGRLLTIEFIGAGTNATTLAVTNIQGNSAGTTYTFNAANETLVLTGGELKWNVVKEIGVTIA